MKKILLLFSIDTDGSWRCVIKRPDILLVLLRLTRSCWYGKAYSYETFLNQKWKVRNFDQSPGALENTDSFSAEG